MTDLLIYEFDCWYLEDGNPLKRYVEAYEAIEAMTIFEKAKPDMGYDYPYEASSEPKNVIKYEIS